MTVTGQDCLKTLARERFWGDLGVAPLHELAERLDRAQPHRPGNTTPCQVTPVVLQGVLSPDPVILHGVVPPEPPCFPLLLELTGVPLLVGDVPLSTFVLVGSALPEGIRGLRFGLEC